MTRRTAIKQLLLLSAGLLKLPRILTAEPNQSEKSRFTFAVLNDLHVTSPECVPFLEAVANHIKSKGAEFCLIAGDLTEKGDLTNLERVKTAFKNSDLPIYPVPGNHDYVTQTDRTPYLQAFPDRLNYTFTHKGWQFIALDTTDGQKYQNTTVPATTIAWLEKQISTLSSTTPTVAFTHFPLIPFVPMCPTNSEQVINLLKKLNLKAIFCGHYHGLVRITYQGVPICINYCCALHRKNHDGTTDKGFYLCHATAAKLTIEPIAFQVQNNLPVFENTKLQKQQCAEQKSSLQ